MPDDERTTNPNRTVVTVITAIPKVSKPRDACLVVIYGDDLGRRIPIGAGQIIIGRSSKCDVQIDQESVSRNHARIRSDGKGYWVRDLGSTNGTYVNDELVDERELRDGDQVKVGRTIFKFMSGNNVEASYHEEIYRLMTVDGLTEVHNKRYFNDVLERELSRCRRYQRVFSIVLFDIDFFKKINDTYGHLAGDAVLRQLGAVVRSKSRRDDVVARVGGEEFGVVLPEIDRAGALAFAEKLRKAVEKTAFKFEETIIPLTVSLGVATIAETDEDPLEIVKRADQFLYDAKRSGRNQVRG